MKFEELLMQQGEEKQTTKLHLQQQVERLEEELERELQLKRVLQCTMQGPTGCCDSCSCLTPFLPFKVQMLLADLAVVEEEIDWVERKLNELKLEMYHEKQKKELKQQRQQQQQQLQLRKLPSRRPNRHSDDDYHHHHHHLIDDDAETVNPNKLSVDLIKCLTAIFLKLNQTTTFKSKGSTLTCINTKPAAFSCATPLSYTLDPYQILPPQLDATARDIGPYKNFIQVTQSRMDITRFSQCLPAMRRLRILMQKLAKLNINYFTHKQKLAFWINIYNASIMNAFLQQGLPSTQEKILQLINEAAINVGGFVFKASTIEQCILRHPAEAKHEMIVKHAYGLDYPEPNVIFALCRGSWSSPALRFYMPDEVMNELEKAKVEYLEASVGITSRKNISVPKLMHRNMKDFADDIESLLEWIYSQLPNTSSLKRLMMECLNGETQSPSQKLIEIQTYASEFRYLIPL